MDPSDAGNDLFRGERLVLAHDPGSGLRAVLAIDDTTLGPALGGVRYRRYPHAAAGIREAQRLAAAMTLKNAAAGLPYGGGKAVILDDGRAPDRDALMAALGRVVAGLGGAYLPGVDMGTTTADLATMGRAGAVVSCATDDPSPWTALGVFAAVRAAVGHIDGREGLDGTRVLVQGAGHVGAALARLVADDGAEVLVADIDEGRAVAVAAAVGGRTVVPEAVLDTACDVLAPCAAARVVDRAGVRRLRSRIVVGAANDTLAERADADRLAGRGITYVPDFVANAGGVLHIHALRAGWDEDRLRREVLGIGDRVAELLARAGTSGSTATGEAELLAATRLAEGRRPVRLPRSAAA